MGREAGAELGSLHNSSQELELVGRNQKGRVRKREVDEGRAGKLGSPESNEGLDLKTLRS